MATVYRFSPVTLPRMLAARERRAALQQALVQQYGKPLLCFTMNIAGAQKNSPLIERGFALGLELLRGQLLQAGLSVLHSQELHEATGNEAFFVVDGTAEILKRLAVDVEESSPVGRLFDMDVLDGSGTALGRTALGLAGRRCLLCGHPAKECARSRRHTLQEIQAETERLLQTAVQQYDSEEIARQAVRALLYEVLTTPKPGLVDRQNSGSHRDMDCFTFADSAAALQPYFARCAAVGLQTAEKPAAETFAALRRAGRLAEGRMLAATGGVNTHKGAVFSIGLTCAALGRLAPAERGDPARVLAEAAAMTAGLADRELGGMGEKAPATAGEKLFAQYGITGVRGQAEAGFPAVAQHGLPVLEQGLALGYSLNRAGCAALLHLLANSTDTNIIHRSSRTAQLQLCRELRAFLAETPYPDETELNRLDARFIEQNLSPGGSADLLALCYLLHFMRRD